MHASWNVAKVLVGCKTDVREYRCVSREEAEALAKEFKINYFEISAKQGINIEDCFQSIATDAVVTKLAATLEWMHISVPLPELIYSPTTQEHSLLWRWNCTSKGIPLDGAVMQFIKEKSLFSRGGGWIDCGNVTKSEFVSFTYNAATAKALPNRILFRVRAAAEGKLSEWIQTEVSLQDLSNFQPVIIKQSATSRLP